MIYKIMARNIKRFMTPLVSFSTKNAATLRQGQEWESVVGLEIHVQINSATKLFSGASTKFGAAPNTQVSFYDAGHPGTLPVLNQYCVDAAVLTSLALGCTINKKSLFERKHYFYADLPKGYQITQQNFPIAVNGQINFITSNPHTIKHPYVTESKIKQIQLEEDSGRSFHDVDAGHSLIDLNRAGIPLMEIVFEPDLKSGEEAAALIRELRLILFKLATCDCKMEEGSLRVDANVSVNKPGDAKGTRTEIKNLNSIKSISMAIEYEIARQIRVLENGGIVDNETMMFDTKSKKTISMRDKEKVWDYRFMYEPNLPPLLLSDDQMRRQLPELPIETREKLMKHNLNLDSVVQLQHNDFMLQHFFTLMKDGRFSALDVARFLLNPFITALGIQNVTQEQCTVQSETLAEVLELLKKDVVTYPSMQNVLNAVVAGDSRSPKQIVEENQWSKIRDRTELEDVCKRVFEDSQKLLKKAKAKDEDRICQTLVSYTMKATDSRADVKLVMEIIKTLLEGKIKK